jgi:hypothetical protein
MSIATAPELQAASTPSSLITEARDRAKRRRLRFAIASLATVLVAAAGIVWTSGPPSEPWTIPAPYGGTPVFASCSGSSLLADVKGQIAGAGNFGVLVTLKNVGHLTCAIGGYSRVALGGSSFGTPLQNPIITSPYWGFGVTVGDVAPRFNLPVGYPASFWISGTDEPVGTAPSCQSAQFLRLLIGKRSVATRNELDFGVTSKLNWCGDLAVSPILPGKSGTLPSVPLRKFLGAKHTK